MGADVGEERVAAAGDEAQERRLDDGIPAHPQEVRRNVTLQVVDGGERQAANGGDRLRGLDADEQRADEPGPARHRDQLDVVERRAGSAERVVDDRVGELEVVPAGDLGHHTAVAVVHALAGDHVRADLAVRGDDAEDQPTPTFGMSSSLPTSVAGVRHMITASSPLSW